MIKVDGDGGRESAKVRSGNDRRSSPSWLRQLTRAHLFMAMVIGDGDGDLELVASYPHIKLRESPRGS